MKRAPRRSYPITTLSRILQEAHPLNISTTHIFQREIEWPDELRPIVERLGVEIWQTDRMIVSLPAMGGTWLYGLRIMSEAGERMDVLEGVLTSEGTVRATTQDDQWIYVLQKRALATENESTQLHRFLSKLAGHN